MPIDPSRFHRLNVADTCAIWNVLSSRVLCATSRSVGCSFCCTHFVNYECLHKPRRTGGAADEELQCRLRKQQKQSSFMPYHLDIEDLQDVGILEKRRRLSKGELSSIAFAKRTGQAFLTDDQNARKLAAEVLDIRMVQTTPHLFGWLYFTSRLGDTDKDEIIAEHDSFGRPLAPYFETMYQEALRCQAMVRSADSPSTP